MSDESRRLQISELIRAQMLREAQNRQAMTATQQAAPQNLRLVPVVVEQPTRTGLEWEGLVGRPFFPSGMNDTYPSLWMRQQDPLNQSAYLNVPIQSELEGKVDSEPSFAAPAMSASRALPQQPYIMNPDSGTKRKASPHVQEPLSPSQEQILDSIIMHCHHQQLLQGQGLTTSDIVLEIVRMWNELHTREVLSGKPGIGGILSYETAAKRVAEVVDASYKRPPPINMQQEMYPPSLHTGAALDSMHQQQRASLPMAIAYPDLPTTRNTANNLMVVALPPFSSDMTQQPGSFQKRLSTSGGGSSGRSKRPKLSSDTSESSITALGDILERAVPAPNAARAMLNSETEDDKTVSTMSGASKQLKEAEAIAAEAMNEIQQQSRSSDWNTCYSALVRYRTVHGHTDVPPTFNGGRGSSSLQLGKWVADLRKEYAKKKWGESSTLTDEQIAKLDKIDFQFEQDDCTLQRRQKEEWENYYNALAAYVAEYSKARVPEKYEVEGLQLGKWVSLQRFKLCLKSRGLPNTISEDQFARLNQLGFDWDTRSRGTSQLPLSTLMEAFGEPRQPFAIIDDAFVSDGSDMRRLKFLDELRLKEASNLTSEESIAYCLQIVGLVPNDHATRVKLVEQHVQYRIKSGEPGGSENILQLIGSEGYVVNEKSSNLSGRCLRCGLGKIGMYHQNGCARDSIQYCSNPHKQVGWRVPKGYSVGDVRPVSTPHAVKQEWEWLKETYGYVDYETFPGW